MKTIDIHSLKSVSYLSLIKCKNLSEAACVCLDSQNHNQGIICKVEGDFNIEFNLQWDETTQRIRDTWNDMEETVEYGAYCLGMLALKQITNFQVVKQSKKLTGFDYWLGDPLKSYPFQNCARLEVSGILKGTIGQINQRLKEKINQTKKSDEINLPAYIVIVEFYSTLQKIR